MWRYFLLLVFTCAFNRTSAGIIRGHVTNEKNEPLPYATVLVKGTTEGTTTNAEGEYHLELPDGDYTIVCQYMGYRKEENPLNIAGNQMLTSQLHPLSLEIREVTIKAGREDPAYAIIRQAIKKRP